MQLANGRQVQFLCHCTVSTCIAVCFCQSQCQCLLLLRRCLLQPIQVEISPGHVEVALMYCAEMDATIEDLRVMAMHHRSPINSFMFSNKGVLLDANTSALKACHAHTPGQTSAQEQGDKLCSASFCCTVPARNRCSTGKTQNVEIEQGASQML